MKMKIVKFFFWKKVCFGGEKEIFIFCVKCYFKMHS